MHRINYKTLIMCCILLHNGLPNKAIVVIFILHCSSFIRLMVIRLRHNLYRLPFANHVMQLRVARKCFLFKQMHMSWLIIASYSFKQVEHAVVTALHYSNAKQYLHTALVGLTCVWTISCTAFPSTVTFIQIITYENL